MRKPKPDPRSCPPHDVYVKRTVVKDGKTYTFYGCTKCSVSWMDVSR
jgi:DNA-directed RNA polymerase subunit M/transcription elongation factor TFIIS